MFAERLKEAMRQRNINQAELVKRTGIGKSCISQYLSGKYEPKYKNLCLIADAIKVEKDYLIGAKKQGE